ncbi:VOC family protein [Amycolatopsis sp. NPDC098790]|uniref:VOC family protein n=1 Tax=Amycolatopsis sp. NPDC098790 TaxID=3363939 RepID=UPI003816F4A2
MTIQRIERVVYGVDDVERCTRFFEDFGLGPGLTTATGQVVELRPLDDPALPAAVEPGPGLREIVWGVREQRDLERLHERLGSVTESGGVLHTTDETGFGVGFAVASVTPAEPAVPPANRLGEVRRWNRPLEPPGRVRPLRLCHVALNIPKEGREDAVAFYTRIGFRITDQVLPMGTFLRAEGDHDQHTMLLCHRPDRAGTNHTAYEVASFDEVITGANHMLDRGWREARKLGRHTVGSNVFRFLHAPCGGRVEYAADMDRVDDTYETRVHETTPPHHLWTLTTNRDGDQS